MKSIVCFLDILGYTELVNRQYAKDNNPEEAIPLFKNLLTEVLNYHTSLVSTPADEQIPDYVKIMHQTHKDIKINLLSDSILISLPLSDDNKTNHLFQISIMLTYAAHVCLMFAAQTLFFLRGAITIDDHCEEFIDPNNKHLFIFSKALIRAYELEKSEAKYIRVLIDNSVASKFTDNYYSDPCFKSTKEWYADLAKHDFENKLCLAYCSYFSFYPNQKEFVQAVRKALLFQVKINAHNGERLMKYSYFITHHFNPSIMQHYPDQFINFHFDYKTNTYIAV